MCGGVQHPVPVQCLSKLLTWAMQQFSSSGPGAAHAVETAWNRQECCVFADSGVEVRPAHIDMLRSTATIGQVLHTQHMGSAVH
jgi:hypothetical protein